MYREYWNLRRMPFENTPDPDLFYLSPTHREALRWLAYGIQERKGAVVLTAHAGCGKTVLSRKVIRTLPAEQYDAAVIVNPSLSPVELLREVLYQLGVSRIPKSKGEMLQELNSLLLANHRNGKHTVIFIDEAQAIRQNGTLEEIRLLLNFQLNDAYLLTLVMLGQPEWAERLSELPQLEQRISIRSHLRPLDADETTQYVQHRLSSCGAGTDVFTPDSLKLVHLLSGGIPRRINTLCDHSLLVASQRGVPRVEDEVIRRVSPS